MSFHLTCPNCGPRDVSEYSYGGQIAQTATNLPEVQTERWFHRFGCGRWLVAHRDVRTNVVQQTAWLQGDDSASSR
jgi:sarcosine oxidase delta subunit